MDTKAYHDFLANYQEHLFSYTRLLEYEANDAFTEAYDYLTELSLSATEIDKAIELVNAGIATPLSASDYYHQRSIASSMMYQLQRAAFQYRKNVRAEMFDEYRELSTPELFKKIHNLEQQFVKILLGRSPDSPIPLIINYKLLALEIGVIDELMMERIRIQSADYTILKNYATYLKNRIYRLQTEFDLCNAGFLLAGQSTILIEHTKSASLKSEALHLFFGMYTESIRFFLVDTLYDYQYHLTKAVNEHLEILVETENRLHDIFAQVDVEIAARKLIHAFDAHEQRAFLKESKRHHETLIEMQNNMHDAEKLEITDRKNGVFPSRSLHLYSQLTKTQLENPAAEDKYSYERFKLFATNHLARAVKQIQIEDRVISLMPNLEPPTKRARH